MVVSISNIFINMYLNCSFFSFQIMREWRESCFQEVLADADMALEVVVSVLQWLLKKCFLKLFG